LAGKLTGSEAPQDLLAALWGFAQLNHKPDGGLLSKASAAIKGVVGELSPEQQICAAWSLALLGGGDKEVFGALFSALGASLAAAPDSVPVQQLAMLAEAQVMAGDKAKLPEQVCVVLLRGWMCVPLCRSAPPHTHNQHTRTTLCLCAAHPVTSHRSAATCWSCTASPQRRPRSARAPPGATSGPRLRPLRRARWGRATSQRSRRR
jgi:hypothetical protein